MSEQKGSAPDVACSAELGRGGEEQAADGMWTWAEIYALLLAGKTITFHRRYLTVLLREAEREEGTVAFVVSTYGSEVRMRLAA